MGVAVADEGARSYVLDERVSAEVVRVFPFGVFVRLSDGTQGYIRRRELSLAGDRDPRQIVSEGEMIEATVIALPGPGLSLELSLCRLQPDPWEEFRRTHRERDTVTGVVKSLHPHGAFIQVIPGVDGFVSLQDMVPWELEKPEDLLWVGDHTEALINRVDSGERRLQLSIRRCLERQAGSIGISRRLAASWTSSSADAGPDPRLDSENREVVLRLDRLASLGPVLVVDDHPEILIPLVEWLCRRGCTVEGARSVEEALGCLREKEFALALVDIDLSGEDGLEPVHHIRQACPACQIVVLSEPDWLAERSQTLLDLGVSVALAKPLDLSTVGDVLSRVGTAEAVGDWLEPAVTSSDEETGTALDRLSVRMRAGASLERRLEEGLAELLKMTGAEQAVVFHRHPISRVVSIVAEVGEIPLNREASYSLEGSPVRDLIVEGGHVLERRVSLGAKGRFRKMLDLLPFEACIGVPIPAGSGVEHALFLFHREPGAFSHYRLRDASAMAVLLRVALESDAFNRQLTKISQFLLTGQLAAGFSHEVFNKMSGLELQARNLRADCDGLAQDDAGASRPSPDDLAEFGESLQSLLRTTLELKDTVLDFRELSRAERWEPVDVGEVIRRSEMLVRPAARKHGVDVVCRLAEDLPSVQGNGVRLLHVFSNLMLNAVQLTGQKVARMPGAGGLLEVSAFLDGADPERPVKIRFTDTGPGIHYQLWEDIFAVGFSTRPGGTGLGLFIARSLIESMGGAISVEKSVVPLGTTFLVQLPALVP